MTAVAAGGVTFEVGGVRLVSEVTIQADPGELVAVIGPNGAGKSTLLRLLAGDLRPTAGAVTVFDRDPAATAPDELALLRAVLPQHVDRAIPFVAGDVVALGRHPHRNDADAGAERDAEAVRTAMERTEVSHLADRVVATLSGGEQARVALARVLAQEAPLILLDEPTASLDVAHEARTMSLLSAEAAAGRAVVTVLHDLNAAAAHADRLVLMDAGAVRAEGSATDVLRPDVLSSVYGHAMRVLEHPFRDRLLILPE